MAQDPRNILQSKTYYRRHLPHYQPPDATYHVVFRLAGSLPVEVVERLSADRVAQEKLVAGVGNRKQLRALWNGHQKEYFEKFDALLDSRTTGPRWLADERIAGIVAEALRYRDGKEYDLLSYCIMPNHVHAVFTVGRDSSRPNLAGVSRRAEARHTVSSVTDILRLIKGSTARACNAALRRTGPFWQQESYDHVVRNGEELEHTIWYVLNNPVKAELVDSWEQWSWTYCKPNLL